MTRLGNIDCRSVDFITAECQPVTRKIHGVCKRVNAIRLQIDGDLLSTLINRM